MDVKVVLLPVSGSLHSRDTTPYERENRRCRTFSKFSLGVTRLKITISNVVLSYKSRKSVSLLTPLPWPVILNRGEISKVVFGYSWETFPVPLCGVEMGLYPYGRCDAPLRRHSVRAPLKAPHLGAPPETLYHRDDALLYIAYVMLIWAAPIPADR